MKTKIQIKSLLGNLLFELEKEDNTLKETVVEAVKNRADLRGAYLQGAHLRGAHLRGAHLRGAYLQGVDLLGAHLLGADLRGADLRGAYLQGADLRWADLRGAYLQGAHLQRADLLGAHLQGADLLGAHLRGADLRRIYNVNTILAEGVLIVWKKLQDDFIAKLEIPVKAKRVNAIGSRKCRFEYAKVLAIYDGKKKIKEGYGQYNKNLLYKVGEIVTPDKFDNSPLIECSNGIHAFITRQEAEDY